MRIDGLSLVSCLSQQINNVIFLWRRKIDREQIVIIDIFEYKYYKEGVAFATQSSDLPM